MHDFKQNSIIIAWGLICMAEGLTLQELSTERVRQSNLGIQQSSVSDRFISDIAPLSSLADIAQLGKRSNFRYVNGKVMTSAKGIKRVRLTQTYSGYDVFGSSAEAELDANDNFSGQLYGQVARNIHRFIPNPEACQRNIVRLQNKAIRLEQLRPTDPNIQNKDARRIVFADPERKRPRLAYRIEFRYMKEQYVKRPVYFFDACTSFVLLSYDQIKNRSISAVPSSLDRKIPKVTSTSNSFKDETQNACPVNARGVGGNEKIGQITYNTQPFCLNVQRLLTICRMEGTYSRVIDNEESQNPNKQTVAQFVCLVGYQDAVNGAFGVANDALYYGEISGRFFEEKYNFRALDYKPRLVVHYGSRYENAFWDGTDMFFGDGGSTFYPFTDVDTVAHELAHGLIDKTSNLVYRGMPGGINEAFADITGEATKFFARNSNDWLISHDIVKPSADFEAIRYFEDPRDDGRSIKYAFGFRPFMDVHYSSGVFNHAFYALVELEKMDIYDAYKCFLDANLNLWGPFTDFFKGACNVMQAAYDNGFSHRKVRRAFWRVGIPLIFCRFAALTTSMFAGETRDQILVRETRMPIIKVQLDKNSSNSTFVKVKADHNTDIKIVVGTDVEATQVIASGINSVRFNNHRNYVYVKLSTAASADVPVAMEITV